LAKENFIPFPVSVSVKLSYSILLIGQNNVGQNFCHLDIFRHFCPVNQPKDSTLGQNFCTLFKEKFLYFCPIR